VIRVLLLRVASQSEPWLGLDHYSNPRSLSLSFEKGPDSDMDLQFVHSHNC